MKWGLKHTGATPTPMMAKTSSNPVVELRPLTAPQDCGRGMQL